MKPIKVLELPDAIAPRVEALRQCTQLHKIIMQFKGWEQWPRWRRLIRSRLIR